MSTDALIDRLTIPGRVLSLRWSEDTQPSGPGWVAACWSAEPATTRQVIEVVASTLTEALERLAARLGVGDV
ncbi:MAG: hypothetical protein KF809_17195 [Chloroflexi bacterium]|nr:hypothetical protein [Chloroflexota bacterium]